MLRTEVRAPAVHWISLRPSSAWIIVSSSVNSKPLPAGSEQYAKAYGIVGTLAVSDLDAVNPNAVKPARHVKALDPATDVSHTFTIAALGLNVPVAPQSVTTFRFHTGQRGSYEWRCVDPCGAGDAGWGGAMSAKGYMVGTVTLA